MSVVFQFRFQLLFLIEVNTVNCVVLFRSEEQELSPVDAVSHDHDAHRRKRGSGTKVGGAAASAKTATKNSGNKKNFRLI